VFDAENAVAGLVADLSDRLRRADDNLGAVMTGADPYNQARLGGKREGVRLALSYLEEYDHG
jgi:hypothetical protein